jgi:hypothetical protein
MHWASVYLGGTELLVPPAEYQVIAFLLSVRNLAFSHFDRRVKALCYQGSVECWASMLSGEGRLQAPAE